MVSRGVIGFMSIVSAREEACYPSVISIGKLQRGVAMFRYRGEIHCRSHDFYSVTDCTMRLFARAE